MLLAPRSSRKTCVSKQRPAIERHGRDRNAVIRMTARVRIQSAQRAWARSDRRVVSSCHSFVYCRPGCTPSPTTQSGCRSSSSRVVVGGAGAVGTGVVVGVVVLAVSMLTKYPLGVAKVLPFTVHSAGDYLAVVLLLVAPWVLNFADGDTGLTAFYIVAGVAVLAVSLITNYQYSPKREWASTSAAPSPA